MPYLLTGKVFCGKCGSPMLGESGTSHTGAIHNYYKCFGRKKGEGCTKATERKDDLERIVVEETINKILQPGVIPVIAEKVAVVAEKEFNENSRLPFLQIELKNVQNSIRNILNLVEQGINTDDVGERLLDLNSKKADIQKQIAREEHAKPLVTKEQIAYWLSGFVSDSDIDNEDYQARIIDTLVNKVFVFDNDDGSRKIVITYNVSGIKSDITLSDVTPFATGEKFGYCRQTSTSGLTPQAYRVRDSGTIFIFWHATQPFLIRKFPAVSGRPPQAYPVRCGARFFVCALCGIVTDCVFDRWPQNRKTQKRLLKSINFKSLFYRGGRVADPVIFYSISRCFASGSC